MKMTKDEGSWSPEFWQASGGLGVNLDGINLEGTVDAAFYRAGVKVPNSVLNVPELGERTEDTNADEITNNADSSIAVEDSQTEEDSGETFDKDTIYSSGTFEVKPDTGSQSSVFQGSIALEQMKITKEDDDILVSGVLAGFRNFRNRLKWFRYRREAAVHFIELVPRFQNRL